MANGNANWPGSLRGPVDNEEFARLTKGQHPLTGEQFVRHQPQKRLMKTRSVKTMPETISLCFPALWFIQGIY
jgi:hypothetical protein